MQTPPVQQVEVFTQTLTMGEKSVELTWQCQPTLVRRCVQAYVQAWATKVVFGSVDQPVDSMLVRTVFTRHKHGWLDMGALPVTTLAKEALWLSSLWQGLTQAFPEMDQWTLLQETQPRAVFSHSIVLPSVLDRDFIEQMNPLIQP